MRATRRRRRRRADQQREPARSCPDSWPGSSSADRRATRASAFSPRRTCCPSASTFRGSGLMLMNGQPKTTSEYIQATSRVGRGEVPALVVTLLRRHQAARPLALRAFLPYHAALYRHVEPTSVTPFSPPSRARGTARRARDPRPPRGRLAADDRRRALSHATIPPFSAPFRPVWRVSPPSIRRRPTRPAGSSSACSTSGRSLPTRRARRGQEPLLPALQGKQHLGLLKDFGAKGAGGTRCTRCETWTASARSTCSASPNDRTLSPPVPDADTVRRRRRSTTSSASPSSPPTSPTGAPRRCPSRPAARARARKERFKAAPSTRLVVGEISRGAVRPVPEVAVLPDLPANGALALEQWRRRTNRRSARRARQEAARSDAFRHRLRATATSPTSRGTAGRTRAQRLPSRRSASREICASSPRGGRRRPRDALRQVRNLQARAEPAGITAAGSLKPLGIQCPGTQPWQR